MGVALGLGPVLAYHVHARARAHADDLYAHRLVDAVGDRARVMSERLARLEQDLSTCAAFVHGAVVPSDVAAAAARALRTRHPILIDVRCGRADAAPDGVDDAALAATRGATASGRPSLARLGPVDGPDASRATLVVPWTASDDGDGEVVIATLRLDAWLAPTSSEGADASLDVALLDTGPDGRWARVAGAPDADERGGVDRPMRAADRLLLLRGAPTAAFEAEHRPRPGPTVPLLVCAAWEAAALALLLAGRAARADALARQATTTRHIFRALVEGVVVAGPDGRVTFSNEAAAALLGPRPPDADADAWLRRAPLAGPDGPGPRGSPADVLTAALAGTTVPEHDWRFTDDRPDGWLAVSGRPLREDGAAVAGAVVVLRDVSARRRTRAALERLSRAIEQAADVVFITDREGRIQYANPSFERLTGWRAVDALGRTPRILKSGLQPPEDYARMWRTILAGDVHRATVVNRRPDGATYVIDETVTPIRDADGTVTHFVAVAHDATERVELERRDAELSVAADVQRRLAPREAPVVDGLDVAGRAVAAEVASGDTWDAVVRPDGRLLLAVADVSGHGMGPALLMAETRAYLRSLAATDLAPHVMADRLEGFLRSDLPDAMFVTMLLVEVDPATRTTRYHNAGHVPGIVIAADGTVVARLTLSGRVLGLDVGPDRVTRDGPTLVDGDVLLLATDGATECPRRDGEPLDEEGVVDLARELRARPAAGIVEGMHAALADVSGGASRRDDVTLVVAKAVPRGAPGLAVARVGDRSPAGPEAA
ncbi:MAG: SpoIIE family protein phosphatase [Planctomycetota bacterium]